MPQASDEDREKYSKRFGDIDCNHAVAELRRLGYTQTPQWEWIAPKDHKPTDEELFWIEFLVDEWDFGGWLVPGSAPTEEPPSLAGIAPDYTEGVESATYIRQRWSGEASAPAPPGARFRVEPDGPPCPTCGFRIRNVRAPGFTLDDGAAPPSEPPAPVPGRSTTSINWTQPPEQVLGDIVEAALSKMTPEEADKVIDRIRALQVPGPEKEE
jgi:hypothetical protein